MEKDLTGLLCPNSACGGVMIKSKTEEHYECNNQRCNITYVKDVEHWGEIMKVYSDWGIPYSINEVSQRLNESLSKVA